MKPLQLDGTTGGGQMLRTALSLAMVTGQPFRMTNIRGKRPKPGLMRQHLTCVKAACEISGGTADGAEIGSTELVFRAGKLTGGNYQFAIGTAGSTGLLFQTLLPALLPRGWPEHAPARRRHAQPAGAALRIPRPRLPPGAAPHGSGGLDFPRPKPASPRSAAASSSAESSPARN